MSTLRYGLAYFAWQWSLHRHWYAAVILLIGVSAAVVGQLVWPAPPPRWGYWHSVKVDYDPVRNMITVRRAYTLAESCPPRDADEMRRIVTIYGANRDPRVFFTRGMQDVENDVGPNSPYPLTFPLVDTNGGRIKDFSPVMAQVELTCPNRPSIISQPIPIKIVPMGGRH